MPRPRNKALDYLAYLVARTVAAMAQAAPLWLSFFVARGVAWCLFRFDHKHRERALGHLQRSFPDWPAEQVRRTARRSFRQFACTAIETICAPRRIRPESYPGYFRMRDMGETIRLQVAHNGPVLLLTGHFGNWEAAGYMTAAIGLPTLTIARKVNNPYMNAYLLRLRERMGQQMVDKDGGAGEVDRAMADGQTVSIVFDQDAGAKGVFVDFFGRPASTYKSIGLMAMAHNAPISVVTCRRLDESYHFEVAARRVIYPSEWSDKDQPLEWITQEYTKALEAAIRTDPGQYFWMHRRWKVRPKGEAKAPGGIS